jgi:cytochrome c553
MRVAVSMNDATKGLSDDDLRSVADLISKLPPPQPAGGPVDEARIERARALVQQNHCNFCHTPNFAGQQNVPRIADQREDYLIKALRGYKDNSRRGYDPTMAMPPPTNAQLRSIATDGSDAQIIAHGIRQVVGMDFNPTSKVLYFTENQRDWLSEDEPQDKLNRLLNPGKDNFGFPYCDGGNIEDPQFGWGHSCKEFTKPIAQLGPHTAPFGHQNAIGRDGP